jgi:predicted MPP superfamily phosphohydrolase
MRRRRFLVAVHVATALAHVVPTLVWCILAPWWLAIVGAALSFAIIARRVQRLLGDPQRSRWVVRLFDQPLFWHWGAGMLALPLLLAGGLVLSGLGLAGCGVSHGPETPVPFAELTVGSFGAGLLLAGWAIFGRRRWVVVRQLEIRIPGLAEGLDGYRIAHLSDLHIGSYDRVDRGRKWVEQANALDADLVAVTGDLVTSGTAYYEDVAAVLEGLRARDGVLVSMGNHDQWNNDALTEAIERRGPKVLRNAWVAIEREGARLVVAGLDDAYTEKNDLDRTLADRPPGVPTVLLAHYPDFFRAAAERGVALVLSGHTHGGQFGIPFFAERWNLARALGLAGRGVSRAGGSTLHVSAGLGTTGPPMRLGVAPEIALLVLKSAPVV